MSEPNNPANRLDELVSRFEKDARERPAITAADGDESAGAPIEAEPGSAASLSWAGEILAETQPAAAAPEAVAVPAPTVPTPAVPAPALAVPTVPAPAAVAPVDLPSGRRTIFSRVRGAVAAILGRRRPG